MRKRSKAIPRFALLSPCGWGNLGDAAIIDATIQNLRARCPGASFVAMTLVPDDTIRRHGIPATTLGDVVIPGLYYIVPSRGGTPDCTAAKMDSPAKAAERPAETGSMAASPESGPSNCLFRIARAAARALLPRDLPWKIRADAGHVRRAWRLLATVDLLVVAGGGQLDDFWGGPWGHPYTMLKWAILARLRGVPIVVLSVGTCDLDARLSRWFVRMMLRLAIYRSYRDAGSLRRVQEMGLRRADPVVPDLAFSLTLPPGLPDRVSTARDPNRPKRLALSPIAYHDPRVWPRKDAAIYQGYLNNLADFASRALDRGYEIQLFASDSPDYEVVKDLYALIEARSKPKIDRVTIVPCPDVADLLRLVAAADAVVASRLHGVLLSQLTTAPVLAVSYDRKVSALMDDMDQSRFCVGIDACDPATLAARFEALERESDAVSATLRSRYADYRAALAAQYDLALETVGLAQRERT